MNEEQLKKLNVEKHALIKQTLESLISIGKKSQINLPEVEQAKHAFEVIQHITAICISEASMSFDNLTEISDELATAVKRLALVVYEERSKLAKQKDLVTA